MLKITVKIIRRNFIRYDIVLMKQNGIRENIVMFDSKLIKHRAYKRAKEFAKLAEKAYDSRIQNIEYRDTRKKGKIWKIKI